MATRKAPKKQPKKRTGKQVASKAALWLKMTQTEKAACMATALMSYFVGGGLGRLDSFIDDIDAFAASTLSQREAGD